MRVLQVSHYMPPHHGGIERVAASLVEGLARRGHDVRWVASATPVAPGNDDTLYRVGAWNGLEKRLGVPYPIWSPTGVRTLARLVSWADVVHVHDCMYMGSVAATCVARRRRKPVVLTQHVGYVPYGPILDRVQRLAYATLGRATLSRADVRVACSAHVPQYFGALDPRLHFRVVANAISDGFSRPTVAARIAARRLLGVPADAGVVLFAGRLVPKKGVAHVIAAQRELAREGVRLVVVGEGPLASLLEGAPGTVHLPRVDPDRMPAVYAAADLVVLPSRGEGMPLVVQEAMLSDLPVVVSRDPAFLRNLLDAPGVACVDPVQLAPAIRRTLTARPPAGAIADWARARWTSERFLDSYEQIYTEVAHG